MQDTAAIALVLGFAFLAANLPFFSERIFFVGPVRAPKAAWWRVAELAVLMAMAIGVGKFIEGWQGQRAPQGWEFYVSFACLFLTFAFPGFVWRYLRRGGGG
jgi:hypothetical protein